MPLVHRLISSLLLAALAAGCRDSTAPDPRRSELDTNRQKWAEHGYTSYVFTLRMDCFCAINGPVVVQVQSDTVARVTLVGSPTPLDAPWIPTIDKLFDGIAQEIDRSSAVLRVTYHPTLGYPTEFYSDPIPNAVDDEVRYIVTDLQPTASRDGRSSDYGMAPAAPARRGSAPAVTRPFSIRSAAP